MGEDAKDPAELLMQALRTLAPEDRDAVLTWLLRAGFRGSGISGLPSLRRMSVGAQLHQELQLSASYVSGRRGSAVQQQGVPVRFPAEQHAQLRDWCAEHGFSMATVIRGLVTRFLESQLPERN